MVSFHPGISVGRELLDCCEEPGGVRLSSAAGEVVVGRVAFRPAAIEVSGQLGKDGIGHFKSREGVVMCADRARAVSSGAHNDHDNVRAASYAMLNLASAESPGALTSLSDRVTIERRLSSSAFVVGRRVTVLLASSLAQLFFIAQYPELRAGQRPA
jgi:hypothetical protein